LIILCWWIWYDMLVICWLMIDLCYNGVSIELSVSVYWLVCDYDYILIDLSLIEINLFIIYWLICHLLINLLIDISSSIICLSIDWLVNYWLIYHLLIDLSLGID
jgi:hypothetical protein